MFITVGPITKLCAGTCKHTMSLFAQISHWAFVAFNAHFSGGSPGRCAGSSDAAGAEAMLEANAWDVESAVDFFFSTGTAGSIPLSCACACVCACTHITSKNRYLYLYLCISISISISIYIYIYVYSWQVEAMSVPVKRRKQGAMVFA